MTQRVLCLKAGRKIKMDLGFIKFCLPVWFSRTCVCEILECRLRHPRVPRNTVWMPLFEEGVFYWSGLELWFFGENTRCQEFGSCLVRHIVFKVVLSVHYQLPPLYFRLSILVCVWSSAQGPDHRRTLQVKGKRTSMLLVWFEPVTFDHLNRFLWDSLHNKLKGFIDLW